MPLEVTPIIAAMVGVGILAGYKMFHAASKPDVRITRLGGVNDWQEKLKEHEDKKPLEFNKVQSENESE